MPSSFPTTVPGVVLTHGGMSDTGRKRPKNEDAAGFFHQEGQPGSFLMLVADGVGGNAAGEVASQLCVQVVHSVFFAQGEPADPGLALHQGLTAANRSIYEEGTRDPRQVGMATTCTAVAIRGQELFIAHIGDCRAYLVEPGQIRQLTQDHSVAAEYLARGIPLPPEKKALANVLTRWLGTETEVHVDLYPALPLGVDSSVVLCSDGLDKVVQPQEILHAVSLHLPQGACQRLVDLANDRGGPDNITVEIARLVRE